MGGALFGMVLALSYAAGHATAITSTSPQRVVLRIYGDTVIAASFDRATKSMKKTFVVFKVGEPGLVLRLEAIGPLEIAECSRSQRQRTTTCDRPRRTRSLRSGSVTARESNPPPQRQTA